MTFCGMLDLEDADDTVFNNKVVNIEQLVD